VSQSPTINEHTEQKSNQVQQAPKEIVAELLKDETASAAEDVVNHLPPEIKKVMEIGFSMQRFSGPIPPAFADKINEEHITQILNLAQKDSDLAYKDSLHSKYLFAGLTVIFLVFFVIIAIYFVNHNKDQMLQDLIKMAVAFIGGIGGGFGLKSYFDK